ncbi:MAG: OmpA family protein [Rhodoferax sp.]
MFFLSIRQVLPVALMLFTGQFVADVQAAAPPPAPAPAPAVASLTEINVTSYANGAWILKKPAEYNEAWSAFWLLDERALTGWATPNGSVGPQEVLIALAEESVIKTVEFDNASADGDSEGSRSAKDIVVQVSNQGPTTGFETIATVSLKARQDKQRFSVIKLTPARWVKLTIKNNHGSAEYIELFDFRAFGEQKTKTVAASVSGTYATNYGNFHLQQEGASVFGCYEHGGGLVTNGGVEGRVTRFTWTQTTGRGPAIFAFSPDGKEVLGIWWYDGQTDGPGELWYGTKTSDSVGSCPHWKGVQTASSQMAKDIGETGRVRIYGINFDTDSDVIKPESKTALDSIVKLTKEKPDWKFTIEGHTDSTATAAHNQTLSEKRAASVKLYLVTAGVAATRLNTLGFGATKQVGDNNTSIGRAQNRRVELVKN